MANPPPLAFDDTRAALADPGGAAVEFDAGDDGLVLVGTGDDAVMLVPGEDVLLLAVPLPPLANTTRRREALPFAIEDRIAQPLDDVHVALGAELSPGVWLAGVVRHAVMARWVAQLEMLGAARAALVPDPLVLPVPDAADWSVEIAGARALVRTGDGGGFALPIALFEHAWRAGREPGCVYYGEGVAGNDTLAAPLPPLAERLRAPPLDLRQGLYAAARRPFNPLWRRIALVAGLGAVAHGAILFADTLALNHQADAAETAVRATAMTMQHPIVVGADLNATLDALTPANADAAGAAGSGKFVALLSRIGAGLTGAGAIRWRSVAFDRAAGTMILEVEADNIAALQNVAQALAGAGLSAQPGAASFDNGHAVGSFTIRAT